MIKLMKTWWNFSQCWGCVGAPLFWWTAFTTLLFVIAAMCFLRHHPFGHVSVRARWVFLLCIIAAIAIHFFILLITWSQVWGTLYATSYHWSPGERENNAFLMWQAAFGLGVLSSSLLVGSLIMMKPQMSANNTHDGKDVA